MKTGKWTVSYVISLGSAGNIACAHNATIKPLIDLLLTARQLCADERIIDGDRFTCLEKVINDAINSKPIS